MDEITNSDQLEAWLKDRLREDAVLIAARCALRVFPLLAPAIERNPEEHRKTIFLPICRAMAVASVTGIWPTQAAGVREVADAASASARAATRAAARGATAAATDAADAARAAAFAAADAAFDAARAATDAARAATAATDAATAATDAARAVFWKTVDYDANALARGWFHGKFNETPLWHAGAPRWVREPWHVLRDDLLSAGDDWFVWVDWYQDRLDGKPANEELEVAKALIPSEIWEAGPATLNAKIARLIGEYSPELPEALDTTQQSSGERFGGAHEQRIDIADDPLAREIRTDEIAQEFHAEVVDAAEQVLQSCRNSNQLDRLAEVLHGYLTRLGSTPEEVRPSMVGRGERLRTLRDAELRLQGEDDPIPGPMAPDAFARLQDLIAAHNQYVATDPRLKEIQDALSDPDAQVRAVVTPEDSRSSIDDLAPILTDAAVEALISATEAARAVSQAGNRARVWLSEAWRNLSVEMFRRALFQLRQSARALADNVELSAKLTVAEAMEATQAVAAVTWRNAKRGALGMGIIEVTPSVAEAMGSLTHGMDIAGRVFRAAEVVAGTALVPVGGAVGLVVVALLVQLLSKTDWFRNLLDDEQVKKLLPFLKA